MLERLYVALVSTAVGAYGLAAIAADSNQNLAANLAATPICQLRDQRTQTTLYQCGALRVLMSQGQATERAKAIGHLHRENILSNSVLEYFANKVFEVGGTVRGFLTGMYYEQWIRVRQRETSDPILEEMKAFADAAGIYEKTIRRALHLPDFGTWADSLKGEWLIPDLSGGGCTSAIKLVSDSKNSNPKNPKNQRMIIGRNLDFSGVGTLDQHPLLSIHHPEPGSTDIAHVVLGADGLFFGSVSGFNAQGIYVVVHQNYTIEHQRQGNPLILIGEAVLRKARTLDQAVELLKAKPPFGIWTFVVADLKTKTAITLELSPRSQAIRNMEDGVLIQTNHLTQKELVDEQRMTFANYSNSILRKQHAMQALQSPLFTNDPVTEMRRLLAYQSDPLGHMSANRDIIKPNTVHNWVLDVPNNWKEGSVWIAVDPAPTASGAYVRFPIAELFNKKVDHATRHESIETPERRQEQIKAAQAYHLHKDRKDPKAALAQVYHQSSVSAMAYRSVLWSELGDYAKALQEVKQARGARDYADTLPSLKESLGVSEVKLLHRTGAKKEALELASSLQKMGMRSRNRQEWIESYIQGRGSIWKQVPSLDLDFEYFAGDYL